mgnify:CR=1 FL=1
MKKNLAFTLAEVLITLGVIGIVAAMTLPQLIKNFHHKVLETKLKKSISVIYQVIQKTKDEIGVDNLTKYCTTYTKNTSNYPHREECLNILNKNTFKSNGKKLKREKTICKSYNKKSNILITNYTQILAGLGSRVFHTNLVPDGSFLGYEVNELSLLITVDTNGEKGPNILGHDIFIFKMNPNNDTLGSFGIPKLYSDEELESEDYQYAYIKERKGYPCFTKSNQKANGIGCAYYALRDECPDGSGRKYFECLP